MIRRAAAVVFVLAIHPALVQAQEPVLTITVPSAEVHKGPTTVTPVIGHATLGTVLPVSRNLGSWVRVPWPESPDGVGYVHVTMGRIGAPDGETASTPKPAATIVASGVAAAPPPPPPLPPRTVSAAPAVTSSGVGVRNRQGTERLSHLFAVGGLVGSTRSFGASARAWTDNRVGVQATFTRDALTSDVVPARAVITQVEPAVLYALFDRVTDQFWIRPYVGGAVSLRHQTLDAVSNNGVGLRLFGGSELTFAGAPQFALSADAGYRRVPAPLPGFETSAFGLSFAAHWYLR